MAKKRGSIVLNDLQRYGPDASADRGAITLAEAQGYCRRLARASHENFTVVSRLLPRRLHAAMFAVYAYCRWADDLADEVESREESLRLLDWWEGELDQCFDGRATHPVMIALGDAAQRHRLSKRPLADLLIAFRRDQMVASWESFDQLLDYCRFSADPVGRIILELAGCLDATTAPLSDSICTALQLTNFWQDVARDADRGRLYLPADLRAEYGYTDAMVAARESGEPFRRLMTRLVDEAEVRFAAGEPLVEHVPRWLRLDVLLFIKGGRAVLDAIRSQGYNVWRRRPHLSKWTKTRLAVGAALGLVMRRGARVSRADAEQGNLELMKRVAATPAISHVACHAISRASGSSFYRSFWLLPRAKRLAMEALYAFMFHTDAIADADLPTETRRALLQSWRDEFEYALAVDSRQGQTAPPRGPATAAELDRGRPFPHIKAANVALAAVGRPAAEERATRDAASLILPAVLDAVRRYAIEPQHFFDVIDGCRRDLGPFEMETFDQLADYCHHVATAVGLASIPIWGAHGEPAAYRSAAEACGLAFQLTNILRDLREDALAGRVYLPTDELRACGYAMPDDFRRAVLSADADVRFEKLMRTQRARTAAYYRDALGLYDVLTPEGRRVYGMMHTVYFRLFRRIARRPWIVLSRRARLPRLEKLFYFGRWLLLPPRRPTTAIYRHAKPPRR